LQLTSIREGFQKWRNKFDPVVHRERPSKPNLLWIGDGTPIELYYRTESTNAKGHIKQEYWKRKVGYLVIDAYNDAIMGLSIGDTESTELAKQAWTNACIIQGVLPYQVKTDNFSKKQLKPFYESIASSKDFYTPSAVGNARDKVIEPFFGKFNNLVLREFEIMPVLTSQLKANLTGIIC